MLRHLKKFIFLTCVVARRRNLPSRDQCGKIQSRTANRIVNGKEVIKGSHPWQVNINSGFCGGSLINDQWVLTAAHCVEKQKPEDFKVAVGQHMIGDKAKEYTPSHLIVHEGWGRAGMSDDIALLKLSEKVNFGDLVQPVCLPDKKMGIPRQVTVTGWGRTSENGPGSTNLLQVSVPVISNADCGKSYPGDITEKMVCAGLPEGGKDSCQGDSGGPMVFSRRSKHSRAKSGKQTRNGFRQTFQLGVVSWGVGCARPGSPGVYTRVSEYLDWIEDKLSATPARLNQIQKRLRAKMPGKREGKRRFPKSKQPNQRRPMGSKTFSKTRGNKISKRPLKRA